MHTRTRAITLTVAAMAALLAAYFVGDGRGRLCEYSGGRWGMMVDKCYTRDCYREGDCGYWSNPASRCKQLTAGDSINTVYFVLGNPDEVQSTRYQWRKRKGYGIDAVIENGRLQSLDCRVGLPGP